MLKIKTKLTETVHVRYWEMVALYAMIIFYTVEDILTSIGGK